MRRGRERNGDTQLVALAECHRFEASGQKLVVHVATRHFFAYDERAELALGLLERGPLEREALEAELARQMGRENAAVVMRQLDSFGLLMDPRYPPATPPGPSQQPYIGAADFNVASACNLRCRYCFVGFDREHPQWVSQPIYETGGAALMSEETARRAVDWLLAAAGPSPSIHIIFFGGEPLLAFDLVRYVMSYTEETAASVGKTVRFGMSTNGVLIRPELLNLVEEHSLDFQVSLDGPPEIHDRFRPMGNGRPSYQQIVGNLAHLPRPLAVNISARATLHRYSLDMLGIVKHFRQLGFRSILTAPAHGGGGEYALRREDWQVLAEALEETAAYYVESIRAGEFFYFPPLAGVSLTYAPEHVRHFTCGAGRQYLCIHTDGGIYLCHALVGLERFRLGDVYEGIRSDLLRQVGQLHVAARENCRECWARYLCGGGCLAVHLEESGDIATCANGPRCDYIRRSFELSMGVRASLTAREIETIQKEFDLASDVCPPPDGL